MRDILGQGRDREPGPWPRRLAVIAAIRLAVVVIAVHLPRHQPGPARPRRAAAASPKPPPSGSAPIAPSVASQVGGITGSTLPWNASLRLPVTGDQPVWFWPATGAAVPIGGLPKDRSGYQFTRVSGGWAVQPNPAAQPACGNCAGLPLPVYFLGDRAASVTQVGLADGVAPGAAPGTLWLTSYRASADLATAVGAAQEVSITGAPRGLRLSLPAGQMIVQETDRGLLLTLAAQRPGPATYELWEPGAARISRTFAGVIATSASEIAWTPRCAALCQVQVLNLATGRRTTVGLPEASSAANAAFSPDGTFLALEVSSYNNGDGGALAAQLDVASTASGRLAVVPRTFVSSDALAGFGWPAASDTLIAELSFTARVQVASWRPGAARLAVAAVRPGQDSASLVVG